MSRRFRLLRALEPAADRASQRLLQLTSEASLLFGIASAVGGLAWYVLVVPPESILDGMTRRTLQSRLGQTLYMNPSILFKTPSHRVYSLLHADTVDCWVYAIHFPTGRMWSTKLERETTVADSKEEVYGVRGNLQVAEAVAERDQELSYRPEEGVPAALSRWWGTTKKIFAKIDDGVKQRQEVWQGGSVIQLELYQRYVTDMLPWLFKSAWWGVTFPVRRAFASPELLPEEYPKIRDGNPSLAEWKLVLKNAVNGVPLDSKSSVSMDNESFRIAVGDTVLTLDRDDRVAVQMLVDRATSRFLSFAAVGLTSTFVLASWWKSRLAASQSDALYKRITKTPLSVAMGFATVHGVFSFPVKALIGFNLCGHYFYEKTQLSFVHVASFVLGNYGWDCLAAWLVFRWVAHKAAPKDLVVAVSSPSLHAAAQPKRPRPFVRPTPVGNLSTTTALDNDIIHGPKVKREWAAEAAEKEKKRQWADMMRRNTAPSLPSEETTNANIQARPGAESLTGASRSRDTTKRISDA
ncbi:hypothetical protein DIPPA_23820 [Diplonema papillatum]|nr:hypothetical protein DIPPA_23820 [Diplonema papillatum]